MTKNFWFLKSKDGFYAGLGSKGRHDVMPTTLGAWRFSDAESAYEYLKNSGLDKRGFTLKNLPVEGFQATN